MKEKRIRKLKKLLINLEAAKALTYYYAGDEYYTSKIDEIVLGK